MKRKVKFLSMIAISLFLGGIYGFSGGDGSSGTPYQVSNATELNDVRNYLGLYFEQADNIDLSGYTNWDAIGDSSTAFTGSFDGKGFTISGLTISRPTENNIGLFGILGSPASLKDIDITSCSVEGQHIVGALFGKSDGGTVDNCSSSGSIMARGEWVGGLGGWNSGGSITNSSSSCSVTAEEGATPINPSDAGGFMGINAEFGTISDSYATGNVTISPGANSAMDTGGGFVGRNGNYEDVMTSTITTCYATGTVNVAGDSAGGFIGTAYTASLISDCYATGNATAGTAFAGGFCGLTNVQIPAEMPPAKIIRCYAEGDSVATTGSYAGGFIGRHQDTSVIEECYSLGNGTAASNCGAGFAGGNTGNSIIRNSYSRGNAGSANYCGGFVGWCNGPIENCYSAGAVTCPGGDVGGFRGGLSATYSSFTNCFYDSDVNGFSDTGNGEPKSTSEMKERSTFTSNTWDYAAETNNGSNDYWNTDYTTTINDGYPYLVWGRTHYKITFATDGNPGTTLTGPALQAVMLGGSCASVTANNPVGYSFLKWTDPADYSTNNPLTITGVTENKDLIAVYEDLNSIQDWVLY